MSYRRNKSQYIVPTCSFANISISCNIFEFILSHPDTSNALHFKTNTVGVLKTNLSACYFIFSWWLSSEDREIRRKIDRKLYLRRSLRFPIFLILESRTTEIMVLHAKEGSSGIEQVLASPVEETVVRGPPAAHWFSPDWYFGLIFIEEVVLLRSDVEIFQHLRLSCNTFYEQ